MNMRGQSLIEVLVSLSVAAVILAAITVAIISSLSNAQYSKNQNRATQYASQGMEIIRQIRDSKSTLSGYSGNYCLPQDSLVPTGIPPCGLNAGSKDIVPTPIYLYSRQVSIYPPNDASNKCGELYHVSVSVLWWDNVCGATSIFCHKVNLVSCFADRKIVPTP